MKEKIAPSLMERRGQVTLKLVNIVLIVYYFACQTCSLQFPINFFADSLKDSDIITAYDDNIKMGTSVRIYETLSLTYYTFIFIFIWPIMYTNLILSPPYRMLQNHRNV